MVKRRLTKQHCVHYDAQVPKVGGVGVRHLVDDFWRTIPGGPDYAGREPILA
jgi:hypothetical protein